MRRRRRLLVAVTLAALGAGWAAP
ncbi:MAG: hypothetical protein JWL78_290, partial [Chloroflexi bacterium]|nr:hypothetical protein [Chloroflexota bacterium]